jgi:hypothetical protein
LARNGQPDGFGSDSYRYLVVWPFTRKRVVRAVQWVWDLLTIHRLRYVDCYGIQSFCTHLKTGIHMKPKNMITHPRKVYFTATLAVFASLCALSFAGTAFAQGNIEAASCNSDSNVQTENCAEGGLDVGYWRVE